MTVHNLQTLCMNYVTETFLLVSSSVSIKQQLCIVHGQDRKTEQKIQQRTFSGFITIPLYSLWSEVSAVFWFVTFRRVSMGLTVSCKTGKKFSR